MGSPPSLGIIQAAALLDVARVCRNDGIGYAEETPGNDASDFEAIEVLALHFSQDSLQRVLDLVRSHRAKEHRLYFRRHKKEVPSGRMDLAIKGETIESFDDSPVSRVRLTI